VTKSVSRVTKFVIGAYFYRGLHWEGVFYELSRIIEGPGKHRGGVNTREGGKGVLWEAGTGGVLGRGGLFGKQGVYWEAGLFAAFAPSWQQNTNGERQQRSNTAAFPGRLSILCDNFRIVVFQLAHLE
jgi:hypothetical protein